MPRGLEQFGTVTVFAVLLPLMAIKIYYFKDVQARIPHPGLTGKYYGLLLIPAQSEVYINPRSQDRWLASNSTSAFYIMIVIKIFI